MAGGDGSRVVVVLTDHCLSARHSMWSVAVSGRGPPGNLVCHQSQ